MLYWIRYREHDVEMQQAMRYLAEKYSKSVVMDMTDVEIGYSYGRELDKEQKARRTH